jgi:hypothetical protein|tara:strand:- start:135 stop:701 length:567 start_codon:yes stop_codon:yes gene_type:complete
MKFIKTNKKQKTFYKLRKKIFLFIINNIDQTIFEIFGYSFFKIYFNLNYNNNYILCDEKKIIGLISYIDLDKIHQLKKEALFYIIKNPFLLIKIIPKFYIFFKSRNSPHNYLQLLHLILDKNILKKISKKNRDKSINTLHKKVMMNKFIGIYASYSRKNYIAESYYKKNKYEIFDENLFYKFVKKKLK